VQVMDGEVELGVGALPNVFDIASLDTANCKSVKGYSADDAPLRVLVVDDDTQIRRACLHILKAKGTRVFSAGALSEAEVLLRQEEMDLVLLDLKLPDGGGLTLLEKAKVLYPETTVVVMTAFATVSSAVEAMRIGARDYLTKPFSLQELTSVVERAGQRALFDQQSKLLRKKLNSQDETNPLIGNSPEMCKLHRLISRVTFSMHPVLILGEDGTGKEAVARTIHSNGPHATQPFLFIDCHRASPEDLEAELFGQETAGRMGEGGIKPGLLSNSEGGTLFLDEIGELPFEVQTKLMRALQEKEIRVAEHRFSVSVRVLAASNRDLAAMVEQGKFRKDLFFRLNVVNVRIPSLRERREDIPLLASHFLALNDQLSGLQRRLSDDAINAMLEYDWPGNSQELAISIDHACAVSPGPVIDLTCLPPMLQNAALVRIEQGMVSTSIQSSKEHANQGEAATQNDILTISEMEKRAIMDTIRRVGGDKQLAAKLLGIGKTTLYRKLREYGFGESIPDAVEERSKRSVNFA
jgi:DNA-binding NtrC family response regulator